jgi:predicted nucleotidyltransferase
MFGIREIDIKKVRMVFAEFPAIEKAILYGSRAKGNYVNGSDIDISLVGRNIDLTMLLKIENQLDDLLLPYTFDLSVFHKIENKDLIEHIERAGVLFYEKSKNDIETSVVPTK